MSNTEKCHGVFYKLKEHKFQRSNGTYSINFDFSIQKKISCKGCDECNQLRESKELILNSFLPTNYKSGVIYKLTEDLKFVECAE